MAEKKKTTKRVTKKKGKGRPTLLTASKTDEIAEYIENGAYIETAAALAGISKSTLHLWLRNGARLLDKQEKGDKLTADEKALANFSYSIQKAQAFSEYADINLIGEHAKNEWAAAAWRLERKFPEKYGRAKRYTEKEESLLVMQIKKLEAELANGNEVENALSGFFEGIEGAIKNGLNKE